MICRVKNTDSLIKRAYAKIWIIRRLKSLGASRRSLLDTYYKHVRSILEYAAPAWNGAITVSEAGRLERVQRTVLGVIFTKKGKSYKELLAENNIERLSVRRKRILN